MFVGGWLLLVILSLTASIAAFIWALRSGQFSDQERARFLALEKDLLVQPAPEASDGRQSAQSAFLLVVVVIGLTAFLTAIIMSVCLR